MKIQECDSFHYKNAINLKKRNNYLVTKLTKTLFYYLIIV